MTGVTTTPLLQMPLRPAGPVGYAWLQDRLGLPPMLLTPAARVSNVSAIQELREGVILVPARLAPGPTLLEHVLFALKHEGINLFLLANALPEIPAQELVDGIARTPNGAYIRKACFLWERFTGNGLNLPEGLSINAGYTQMFEAEQYITGTSRRSPKWRIDFNGLGDLSFCPVVRLTPDIKKLLAEDILSRARDFATSTSEAMLDRALSWAYLSETEGSFAIEGEVPSQSKAAMFANLLKHAGEPKALTEAYLVELQNSTITNPHDMAMEFRQEQNRLHGAGRGAAGVTYVPPEHELCYELMDHLMVIANKPPQGLDPLVHAAVVSFSFVFIHPFMDGNGRLSRFLVHHCLGQSKQLPKGFLLPISIAMKRNEQTYLDALTSFSRPARSLCEVTWLGGEDYLYDWDARAASAFRFMDVTSCVEFTLRMAKDALEHDLLHEAQYLADYDAVHRSINDRFDLRGSDLATLIVSAFEQNGALSNNRRKQYNHRVQPEAMDAIEAEVKKRIEGRGDTSETRVG